jgi:hypothetical protein
MDPDVNLIEQLKLAEKYIERDPEYDLLHPEETAADIQRLAELVQALDHWMTNGGFTPARWRVGRTRKDHV